MRHRTTKSFRTVTAVALFLALAASTQVASAQAFNKEEFAARRAKLFEQIADGVAVVFAAEAHPHAVKFRQAPDFYYLTGVEEPGAVLLLVGRNKRSVLFAHKRSDIDVQVEGPGILNLEKPHEVYGLTQVMPLENFLSVFNFAPWALRRLPPLTAPASPEGARRIEQDEAHLSQPSLPLHAAHPPAVRACASCTPAPRWPTSPPSTEPG